MLISVFDFTRRSLDPVERDWAIKAVNAQLAEDFAPGWEIGASVVVESLDLSRPFHTRPKGKSAVVLVDSVESMPHEVLRTWRSAGFGFSVVCPDLAVDAGEPWTRVLSREILQAVAFPRGPRYIRGPHPELPGREVFHLRMICAPVWSEGYRVMGVDVADFVLPGYYSRLHMPRRHQKAFLPLPAFGKLPGGFLAYLDPRENEVIHYFGEDGTAADAANRYLAHAPARRWSHRPVPFVPIWSRPAEMPAGDSSGVGRIPDPLCFACGSSLRGLGPGARVAVTAGRREGGG